MADSLSTGSLDSLDLVYLHDPVWRGVAPPDFTYPSNLLLSDQVFQFYPWLVFARESLLQGIVPLWNPYVLAGTPFLANQQSAVFYPLNLLLYLLPMPIGIGYLAILRLIVGGTSLYYFIRSIGPSRASSFVGACAFIFGGFSIVWLGSPISNAAMLLPLALLLTEGFVRHGGHLCFAGLALVIGAQFLGGHPETSFHFGFILAAYLFFRLIKLLRDGVRTRVVVSKCLAWAASCMIGFAISSVQVLPFLSILSQTSTFAARRGGPGGDWLLFPEFLRDAATAITILFPNAFGNPSVPYAASWNLFSNFNEQAAYIGTIPLLLAVLGATLWRRNLYAAFWLGVVVLSIGIVYRLPGFEIINHLPLFNLAANGRLRLAVTLGAAILRAFGMDLVADRIEDGVFVRKFRRIVAFGTILAAVGAATVFASLLLFRDEFLSFGRDYVVSNVFGKPGYPESIDYYFEKLSGVYQVVLQFYSPLSPRTYLPVVVGAGLYIALRAFASGKTASIAEAPVKAAKLLTSAQSRPGSGDGPLSARAVFGKAAVTVSLVSLAVAELVVTAYGYNPSLPQKQVFPETEAITFLKERVGASRIAGIGFALTPNAGMLWGLRDVRGYEMTTDHRFQEFFESFASRLPFGAYNLLSKPSPVLFDLLAVKYVIAPAGAVDSQPDFPIVFMAGAVQIHENLDALPRAFLVSRGRPVAEEARILDILRSPTFRPREEVLLESSAPVYEPVAITGEVAVRDLNPNELEVSVLTDAPSWMVLSDTYEEGWRASVDDRTVRIYRANQVMRAIRLDKGQHLVRFKYEPTGFALGAWVSALSLLITAIVALYPLLKHRWIISATRPGR